LTDFVCLLIYEFWLSLWKIARCSVILLLPLFITGFVTKVIRRVSLVGPTLLTLPEHLSSAPVVIGVRVTRCLSFCVLFCRSLFILLSFFIWPLCCLPFFDLWILTTPLVSSNTFSMCVERLLFLLVTLWWVWPHNER